MNLYLNEPSIICFGIESYSIPEVAKALQVDERTVRAWIKAGELNTFSVSRDAHSQKPRLRVLEDDVKGFANLRRQYDPPKPTRRRKTLPMETIV